MEKANDDVVFSAATQLATSLVLPMTLKAAVELRLFEIMSAAGNNFLSATDIASKIHTQNAEAPAMIERILRFLANSSVLEYKVTKTPDATTLLYGLTAASKYFVGDKNGVSLASHLLFALDKVTMENWFHLKDSVVNGGIASHIAHGMSAFDYLATNRRYNKSFNQAMHASTTMTMKKILEAYKGFEDLTQIIDVGGGVGASLAAIVSKYPNIKGINYDLPHVIKDAPAFPGVEHVAGDMFESVPSGEVLFLKYVLHNWSDDQCLKLLKNCWTALPESGKLIVVDTLLPRYPDTDDISNNISSNDVCMLTWSLGGKERTKTEFDDLARRAGFATTKVVCNVHTNYVIEFYKM